ncbi:putative polysaccharide biosynthesis protein [Moorella sulfitireducens]|uniref:putative polysaccharide biosynthesis protein n=1 Tax=Neomoorella sulfitireducens TaxID=2972948 RepID=UPI0021AD3A31|nr:polysaccharide biosynthesis protein [Moorella sulfitireducens]
MGVSIWHGAAVLMLASLLNRIISFAYRILVVRFIGAEGMGLYEMVFPFYSLVLMVASAGVPVALAKLVAERVALQAWGKVRSIFRLSLFFLTGSGLTTALILWFLAPYLTTKFFADTRVYQAFMVMLLALPVVCTCSAFRSYFQGLQLMYPVALAQVSEQVIRVSAGLFLGLHFLPLGVAMAAAGLAMGMVLGELAGLVISIAIFWRARAYYDVASFQKSSMRADILPLARLSLPVMMARAAGGAMLTLEAMLIPHRLQLWGASVGEATTIYGQYAGIAMTLVYLPMVITVAVAMAMVPAIAEARAVRNNQLLSKRCRQALKLTVLSGLPFALFFYLLATPLCDFIFSTPAAGVALKMLSWGSVFIYLEQTTVGILNGLGAVATVFKTTVIGGIVDILGIYFFTPFMGITGAALGVNMGSGVTAILNLLSLSRYTPLHLDSRSFVFGPLLASCGLVLVTSFIWTGFALVPATWRLIQAIAGGGLIYLLILLVAGVITPGHLYLLPWPGHRPGR